MWGLALFAADEKKAGSGLKPGMTIIPRVRTEQALAITLQRAPGDPRNLALNMLVDHLRQILVEPGLEDGPQHFPDHLFERVDLRGGGNGRCDRLELLERLPALSGDLFVDQRRAEVSWRRKHLAELEHILIGRGSSGSGSSSMTSTGRGAVRKPFSSAITFLIDARMSSIEGSRPGDCMRRR